MENLNNYDKIRLNLIADLSKDKLKQYILYLTHRYYESYMVGDEDSFQNYLGLLNQIIDHYKETYSNIMGFVFYCFYLNFIQNHGDYDGFKLENPFTYDLMEDNNIDEELSHDMKKIFNKQRIRERYNEKRINKKIE